MKRKNKKIIMKTVIGKCLGKFDYEKRRGKRNWVMKKRKKK